MAEGRLRRDPRGEWTQFRIVPELGIELLHAHYRQHSYERHCHDTYAIGVTERGVQAFTYRGGAHASTRGTVIVLNPDEPHDGHAVAPEGFVYRMLYIRPALVGRLLEEVWERPVALPFAPAPLLRDRALARAVAALHRGLARGLPALERDALLDTMLLRLATHHADGGYRLPPLRAHQHGALRGVRDYLHATLAEDVTADELARVAGLSRFHLTRLFRRAHGLPLHAYRLQLRLAEAKRLLARGERPAEVAACVGFADQSHLNKRFRGAFGITPAQFARAWRGEA